MTNKKKIINMLYICTLLVLIYITFNYFDIRNNFISSYKINLGNTIAYAKEINKELEVSNEVSSRLLIGFSQSISTQFSLTKILNTDYKKRLAIPIAELKCYSDATTIVAYKILNSEETEADYKILKIISLDIASLNNLIQNDNYISVKEYNSIRGNLKLFSDIDIMDYIIKHNYIFKIESEKE